MKNHDTLKENQQKKTEIFEKMNEAAAKGNNEKFMEGWKELCELIQETVMEEAREEIKEAQAGADKNILSSRGVRQLTSEETHYYEKVIEALRSDNYKQAIANLDVTMPETVINAVFDDLQNEHPLLSKISFTPATGLTKMIISEDPSESATWGKLSAKIIEEVTAGLKEVNMELLKLSAFVFICKAMLDLGPTWIDTYVRQMLYEALANGLEKGIVAGTGKDEPIGMIRQVGDDVVISGGVYPQKTPIKVTAFDMQQVGNLVSQIATNTEGKGRKVKDLILLVNPIDYYAKVLPAVKMLRPDGAYINVFPVDCDIMDSIGVPQGKAVFGMSHKYFMGMGTSKEGKIEFSDHYKFLEDDRTYLVKLYGNGFPKDNNAFLLLDISELQPLHYKVEQITPEAVADDATLSELKIGNLTLTPAFTPSGATYTVTTTDATNVIKAVPNKASAEITVKVGSQEIQNQSAATWQTGANTVKIKVVDGEAEKEYTVTVTKN